MERNSVHTSLVIEVEDQEEPEQQKTYMIDFDDQDIPKDYVVDQVFCGENVTVYALFEVPEGNKKKTDSLMLEIPNSNTQDGYRFIQKSSSKKITNDKRLNGYKPSLPLISSNDSVKNQSKEPDSGSLYCLQSLSQKYGVLTPERKPSDFEVLFSKRATVSKTVKSKFKAVSKGVNTDIVQSPRIIHEVEEAVRLNFPKSKKQESASKRPSCEVIEMEMRQSFSSLSSYGDGKKRTGKSTPNFFLVPLLVVNDGVLSHFQTEERVKKPVEDTALQTKVETSSLGTNTEIPELPPVLPEPEIKKEEEEVVVEAPMEIPEPVCVELPDVGQVKEKKKVLQTGKVNVLREIRKLQFKLNNLIKSLESNDFQYDVDTTDGEFTDSENAGLEEPVINHAEATRGRKRQKHDDLPIFSSMMYPNIGSKRKGLKKKRSQTPEEKKKEISTPIKSNSLSLLSSNLVKSMSQITQEEQKPNARKISSICSINWLELENRKGVGLSKSEDERAEGMGLKKIKNKNSSFKLDGSPKSKSNKRIIQKEETHLQSTMGDEAIQKPKNSKEFLNLSEIKTPENLCALDSKKNLNEEEGDAKLMYSKQCSVSNMLSLKPEKLEVHFCSTTTAVSENLLSPEKSSNPSEVLKPSSIVLESVTDTVLNAEKVSNEAEKPVTPVKKPQVKKDTKTTGKKSTTQPVKEKSRVPDKTPPKVDKKDFSVPEPMRQKTLLTNRKSGGGRANANSKLHIDKLMKPEVRSGSKTSSLGKSGTDEKLGSKSGSRPSSRRREPAAERVVDEGKEKEEKSLKADSLPEKQAEDLNAKFNEPVTLYKKAEMMADFSSDTECSPQSFSNPSVVLELFAEKPTMEAPSVVIDRPLNSQNDVLEQNEGIPLNVEKPVVKSVWALTKVLIFEDGTRKVEILEASLNPPECSLTP